MYEVVPVFGPEVLNQAQHALQPVPAVFGHDALTKAQHAPQPMPASVQGMYDVVPVFGPDVLAQEQHVLQPMPASVQGTHNMHVGLNTSPPSSVTTTSSMDKGSHVLNSSSCSNSSNDGGSTTQSTLKLCSIDCASDHRAAAARCEAQGNVVVVDEAAGEQLSEMQGEGHQHLSEKHAQQLKLAREEQQHHQQQYLQQCSVDKLQAPPNEEQDTHSSVVQPAGYDTMAAKTFGSGGTGQNVNPQADEGQHVSPHPKAEGTLPEQTVEL